MLLLVSVLQLLCYGYGLCVSLLLVYLSGVVNVIDIASVGVMSLIIV